MRPSDQHGLYDVRLIDFDRAPGRDKVSVDHWEQLMDEENTDAQQIAGFHFSTFV